MPFFSVKFPKFWHTACLSRTNRHKVIKSENSPVFLAHPVYGIILVCFGLFFDEMSLHIMWLCVQVFRHSKACVAQDLYFIWSLWTTEWHNAGRGADQWRKLSLAVTLYWLYWHTDADSCLLVDHGDRVGWENNAKNAGNGQAPLTDADLRQWWFPSPCRSLIKMQSWCLRWQWPHLKFLNDLWQQKTRVPGYRVALFALSCPVFSCYGIILAWSCGRQTDTGWQHIPLSQSLSETVLKILNNHAAEESNNNKLFPYSGSRRLPCCCLLANKVENINRGQVWACSAISPLPWRSRLPHNTPTLAVSKHPNIWRILQVGHHTSNWSRVLSNVVTQ